MTTPLGADELTRISPQVAEWLPEIVRRVVEQADPLRVVVFGSYARGEATGDSDIDLLIVVEPARRNFHLLRDLHAQLSDLPIDKDIVLTTPEAFGRRGMHAGTVLRPALSEGITVYERA